MDCFVLHLVGKLLIYKGISRSAVCVVCVLCFALSPHLLLPYMRHCRAEDFS